MQNHWLWASLLLQMLWYSHIFCTESHFQAQEEEEEEEEKRPGLKHFAGT